MPAASGWAGFMTTFRSSRATTDGTSKTAERASCAHAAPKATLAAGGKASQPGRRSLVTTS